MSTTLSISEPLSNVSKAASILGKLGRGKPKTISDKERQRRSDCMAKLNATLKKKRKKSAIHAVSGAPCEEPWPFG